MRRFRPLEMLRASLGRILVVAGFVVVMLVLAWPTLHGETTSVVPSFQTATYPWAAQPRGLAFTWPQSDQAESAYPWAVLARRTWRDGELPLWDPHSFGGGVPWAVDGVAATLYPVRAALDAAFLPWLAHDLFVLVHLGLAGVGAYWLTRRWGGARFGATVAGIGWMTNAYVWSWAQLEMVTPFFAALPLVLASSDAAARSPSRRNTVVAAVLFGLAMLSGNIAYSVITATSCGLYLLGVVVARAVSSRGLRAGVGGSAAGGGAALVLGLGLSAVVLVPTLLNLVRVSRQPFSFQVVTDSLLVPWDTYARLLERPESPPSAVQLSVQLYVTPVVFFLALLGFVLARGFGGWAARMVLLLPVLVASTVPGAWVAFHLFPGFDAIKPYARVLPISLLALYALGGLGADAVWARLTTRWRTPVSLSAAVGVGVLVGVFVPALLVARTLNPPALPVEDYPEFPRTPAIAAMKSQHTRSGWPVRVLPGSVTYDTDPPANFGLTLIGGTALVPGLDTWGGYASAVPERTSELLRLIAGEPDATVLSESPGPELTHPVFSSSTIDWGLACRLGTDLVAMPPAPPEGVVEDWGPLDPEADMRTVYSGADGRVYALPKSCDSSPYLSADTVVAPSDEGAVDELRSQGDRALASRKAPKEVVVHDETGRPLTPGATGTVTGVRRDGSDLEVRVRASGSMWLVLPVAYDDGWSAEVDGRSVDLHRVDFNRLGVFVGAGVSDVRLSYRPVGWSAGLWLSVAGLLVAVALAFPRLKRQRLTESIPDEEGAPSPSSDPTAHAS